MTNFRLTGPWHASRMTYAPAVVAPMSAGSGGRITRHMATAERIDRSDKADRAENSERAKAVGAPPGHFAVRLRVARDGSGWDRGGG